MRILAINYEFPPLGSGAANATLRLCRAWARKGHDVVVLTSCYKGLECSEWVHGFRVERVRVLRKNLDRCPPHELLSFALAAIPAGLARARGHKPDVTLAFFGFPSGPAAWAIRAAIGVPYVISVRNADVPRPELQENRLFQWPLRMVVRPLWRRADAVVSVSAGLADIVRGVSPGLNVSVIPNGVDTDLFQQREPVRSAGPLLLLYVGRLRRFKGLSELLFAVAEARGRIRRTLRLDIVGEGPAHDDLQSMARRLGVADIVRFRGRLQSQAMPEVYRNADIFVFPSHAEGMPNAVLEALATGLPVIGTRIEGTRELVRHGVEGLLVQPGDAPALQSAIVALAADDERRAEMGWAARKRALQFSWDTMADEYLAVFDRIGRERAL
jgi:glycogen synthase